mmetsp:Transcript_21536/g.69523  ORF Transcript_21536/g.69523 Transcript_21536/m.69523 type:complete len:283 (-) Transcript_21536:805-1653(-)
MLQPAHREGLAHVGGGEVVVRQHARRDALANGPHVRGRAEDVGAQRKVALVGDGDQLVVGVEGDDGDDRAENLLAQQPDGRLRGDVRNQHHGRREELPPQTRWPVSTSQDARPGGFGLGQHGLQPLHFPRHAHGADVDAGVAVPVERRTLPHRLGRRRHLGHKLGQKRGVHQVPLAPQAVLAGRAEASAQGGLEGGGHVGARQKHHRVLAAQLQRHRRQRLRRACHDALAHGGRADKDDLVGQIHNRLASLGVACHYLDQVLRRAGRRKARADQRQVEACRP